MVSCIPLHVQKYKSCKSHILHTDIQIYIKNGAILASGLVLYVAF